MKKRVLELRTALNELHEQRQHTEEQWINTNTDADTRHRIDTALDEILNQHRNTTIKANQKKLVNLNGGQLKQWRQNCGYINLTDKTLTPEQEELLNFGLNCHILSKPKKFQKRTECEILIEDIDKLARKGELNVKPTLVQEILAESAKVRGKFNSDIVKKEHEKAVKDLKDMHDIMIWKVDKASAYILIDTTEYLTKINTILSDETKFIKITKSRPKISRRNSMV